MKQQVYDKYINGYLISNASLLNDRLICFFMQKSQTENKTQQPAENLPSRVVIYSPDLRKEDEGFSYYTWKNGIKNAYVNVGTHITLAETFGTVWESRTDDKWHKATTSSEKLGHWITGLKPIDGTLFACGNRRKVYRRDGFKDWVDLIDYETHDDVYADIHEREAKGETHSGHPMGFTCLDGFGANDIYAGGAYGSFWRYDGSRWFCIDLANGTDITDIVCASNGQVYAILKNGNIMVGREDTWALAEHTGADSTRFVGGITSAAWFQDTLYVSTAFDLYALRGTTFSKYAFPDDGPKQRSFGGLTACKDALLSYGSEQALIFDGENWKEVLSASR